MYDNLLAHALAEYSLINFISIASSIELNAVEVLANVLDWKQLGHLLKISPGKIHQFEERGGETGCCREEVVLEWLKEDRTASWEKLCSALEEMGNMTEVQVIKEQYICTQSGSDEGIIVPMHA